MTVKINLSAAIIACSIISSAMPALAANPRLASSPAGDAVCVQVDSTTVWAHYNSDPLTQAWSAGTPISLPISQGTIIQLPDVAYAGNGRYVACWIVSSNLVYSAYTDGGGTWSNPVIVGELLPGHRTSALRIAADSAGNVQIYCSGQVQILYYALYAMRSTDRGTSFSAPEFQSKSTQGIGATKVTLMTNGAGNWYRGFTEFQYTSGGLTPYIYTSQLQASQDGALTWAPEVDITSSFYNDRMLLGSAAFANRACMLSHNGDTMIGGKLTFTHTENNGESWTNSTFPAGLPYFFGPVDHPNFLTTEAEIATDIGGRSVGVYKSKYTNSNDTDLLSFRSSGTNYTDWDTSLTYVSRQIDRNESGIALTTLGDGKFLTAFDIANTASSGIQTALSTDAGASWTAGPTITGNVPTGDLREYATPAVPQPSGKFIINSVTPKIKYKEPKPGKQPKPRKATFKAVIGTSEELTIPESATVMVYLSDDDTLQLGQDVGLYNGTTKLIKPGKSGKATIKFNDFPDPAGKFVIFLVSGAEPYVIAF